MKERQALPQSADEWQASSPGTVVTQSCPPKLKRIIVPIDFSALSKKALHYAATFASHPDDRLILLHVVKPARSKRNHLKLPLKVENGNFKRLDECERALLDFCRAELGSQVKFEAIVQLGKIDSEILNMAKAWYADLIIIGTHAGTGLKHALTRSTTEKVVRHAPCPVLIVREHEHEFI